MKHKFRYFNTFVFLSSFARRMIEVFIPIFLYKHGFSVEKIIYFYFIVALGSLVYSAIIGWLSNYIQYKYFIILSAIAFFGVYFLMNNVTVDSAYLYALSLTYALYRRCYWATRRYYAINNIDKNRSGLSSGFIAISTQAAGMFASFTGGLILNNNDFLQLAMISLTIYILSIIPLFMTEKNKGLPIKINDMRLVLKKIPRSDLTIMVLYESFFYIIYFFPLYIFINVKDTYTFVGMFNFLLGISSIIFIFYFSKTMDSKKHDFLGLITIILSVIFILKLNVVSPTLILIIALFEGYFSKFHGVSYTRNVLYLGNHHNINAYNILIDFIIGVGRITIISIFVIFKLDLEIMLYILITIFSLMSLFKFDDGEDGYI